MIASYLSVLRRRAPLITILTVLLVPLVYVALTAGGTMFRSVAVVQTSSGLAAGVVGLDVPYETAESRLALEIEIFESDVVAERARTQLAAQGVEISRQDLRDAVTVSPRGVSPLLDVTGVAEEGGVAQALTDVYVTAYIEYRRESQSSTVQRVVDDLEAQRAQAEADLLALGDPATASASVQQRIASAQSWYDTVTDRLEGARLRSSVDTSGVTVLAPATPPEPVEGLGTTIAAALSVVGGLLAAGGVALVLDVLRDPVRTRSEAKGLVAVRALGGLPQSRPGRRRTWEGALTDAAHPAAVGARGVRLRLERLVGGEPLRTVMIVATQGDGDDAVNAAAALAASWHRAGRSVVMVADARPGRGPSRLLRSSEDVVVVGSELTARLSAAGVWIVPATGTTGGRQGFLDQADPALALADLHAHFEVVVLVDYLSSGMDTAAVSHLVDATVLVCAVGRTPAKRLQELAHTLSDFGARVDGLLLTEPHWDRGSGGASGRRRTVGSRGAARGTASADPELTGWPAEPLQPVTAGNGTVAGMADAGPPRRVARPGQ